MGPRSPAPPRPSPEPSRYLLFKFIASVCGLGRGTAEVPRQGVVRMERVPVRGWRPGGRGTRCFGGTCAGDAEGVGARGGCPQGLFSEARVAVGAGVAAHTRTQPNCV